MAKITKIELQKNKARVNIFVDDAFFCGANKDVAMINKLKVGQEIEESRLSQIVFESEVRSAFEKAVTYLESRAHSKSEIITKLIKKGFPKEATLEAVAKLEEYKYIDDGLFAKQFVEQNPKLSKQTLLSKLMAKGVDSRVAKEATGGIGDEVELENCSRQIEKYIKSKKIDNKNDLNKMYSSLLRKGYKMETIKKSCGLVLDKSQYFGDLDDDY